MKVLVGLFVASIVFLRILCLPNFEASTEQLGQALHMAASTGDEVGLQRACEAGAPVNYCDSSQNTALMYASLAGHLQAAKWLIQHGADPNARSLQGHTPLMASLANGSPEIARELIDHGANINAATSTGLTALMMAADRGDTRMISLLLERGANCDCVDSLGDTALDHALAAVDRPGARRCCDLLSGVCMSMD